MLDPSTNPFPGLRPFRTDEEYLFFGRDEQCEDLLRLLRKRRFIGVLGSSGTGKSSLVRAGLLPALYRGGLDEAGSHWSVALCRPGGNPARNLAQAIVDSELWDHLDVDHPIPESIEIETVLQRSGMGIGEVTKMAQMPNSENLLVVIDQFEELFRFHQRSSSMEDREKAEAFVSLLLEAARDERYAIHVVLTMRSGFFGDCASFTGLSEVINRGAYLIPRLDRDQLKQAIEGPISVGGASIAPRLTQRLLNDVGGSPDELPVLQHALMRSWDEWKADASVGAPIDLYHYERIGGMGEALARHADEVYHGFDEADQRVARRLFRALTQKTADNRGIRRPMSLERLVGIISAPEDTVIRVIDAFRAPGVSFLMPSPHHRMRPDTIIDISHESLMRVWTRLGAWVDEEMQSARIYQRLAETAALWEERQADLYHDPDLHIARAWNEESHPNALWAEQYGGGFGRAMRFLSESQRQKKEEERSAERVRQDQLAAANALAAERSRSARRSRRFSLLLALFSIACVVLAAAAYFSMRFAVQQARAAEKAQKSAEEARQEVALTFSQSDYQFGQSMAEAGRYGESLAYLTRALKNERGLTAAGDRIYNILTEVSLPVPHFYHRDSRDIEAIAFTPDSKEIVTGSEDDYGRLWDIDSSEERGAWKHESNILCTAVSHDGKLIATGGRDSFVHLINRATGNFVGARISHNGAVNAVQFSPDDTMLLTCSDDHSVSLWDLTRRRLLRRGIHDGVVNDAQFGPDQQTYVSVSDDNTAKLWDLESGEERLQVTHDDDVSRVDFHPTGGFFVTASEDGTAKLWETIQGECLATFSHESDVRNALFSPDGSTIATCSNDRTVRLWNTVMGEELYRWSHRDAVDNIDFSADGRLVASASDDKTVRIWETETGVESPLSPLVHRLDVDTAQFSPDGEWLATVADNEVRVWRFENFREPPQLFELAGITTGCLSPTGQWIAAAAEDGRIKQWKAETGKPRMPDVNHGAEVTEIAYSPDGNWLITGDVSGKVRVWDAVTGQAVVHILNHDHPIAALVMPSNDFLVVANSDQVQSWRLPSGDVGPTLSLSSAARTLEASPDGDYLAVGCVGASSVIIEAQTMTRIHSLTHGGPVNALDFSPHGLLATASDDRSARLWDVATGEQQSRSMGHGGEVHCVQFSPSGKHLVTGGFDQRAILWSTETASVLGRALNHRGTVSTAEFSPDGLRLATASSDYTARIWDVATTLPLTQPLIHEATITQIAFTPSGQQLFTVAAGDAARLWRASLGAEGQQAPDIFLEVAQAIGGLTLTASNQLVPIAPSQRRQILRRAEYETRRIPFKEANAYLRFVRRFLEKHGPDLRPKGPPPGLRNGRRRSGASSGRRAPQ
ncbi:MAG: WD40 repeat domain-containing protein [Verrucomicrobiales bacterium]|nr:WD40 repeat domain-containing protein [Verrucomicrobiales bacterium]